MGFVGTPYLVNGSEPFLDGYKFSNGNYPEQCTKLCYSVHEGGHRFFRKSSGAAIKVPEKDALALVNRLGKSGAYTHELGRYWARETLVRNPGLLRAFARRYPHIIIDEAQDISPPHLAILELMANEGASISLIGDPNQAIFEFTGADGSHLAGYASNSGALELGLKQNHRSVTKIVAVANAISKRTDDATRETPKTLNGAYFVPYEEGKREEVLSRFYAMLTKAGIPRSSAVLLCRATKRVAEWRGDEANSGQGITQELAKAAVKRDKEQSYGRAFDLVVPVILGLTKNAPKTLAADIRSGKATPMARDLRKLVWSFLKDRGAGLPHAALKASSQWHPMMVKAVKRLLAELEADYDLQTVDNVGLRLKKTNLSDTPLYQLKDGQASVRMETVHGVKGESIDAVMYVATKPQIEKLIDGTNDEVGKIGYVAVTRARNLFVLAVPTKSIDALRPGLLRIGLEEYADTD